MKIITKSTKTLYLHGLNGSLSEEKKTILKYYTEVIAPNLNYYTNNQSVKTLFYKYKDKRIDYIIGSSMGGYAGYFLSLLMNIPCLLFNPALPYKSVVQFIPKLDTQRKQLAKIILGKKDDVIKYEDILNFLMFTQNTNDNIKIQVIEDMGHRTPINNFKQEVNLFFSEFFPSFC